jgi:hypothetical protein
MAPRIAAALAASVLALVVSSPAFGAYDPALLVGETSPALGRGDGVRFFVQPRDNDDATGMVTLYAPRGYGVKLDHPNGTELGSAIAIVRTGLPGAARQAVQGSIRAADPAAHASNSCAPGINDAVWIYEFPLGGTTYRLPIYVDRPDLPHASARIRFCPDSPSAPPPTLSIGYVDMTIERGFTNPRARGTYAWNAVFVPYSPGTQALNHALAVQSTAYISLPATFAVTAKRQRRGRTTIALVTACLREAGEPVRGIRVTLWYGGPTVFRSKRVAIPRTDARGCAVARIRIRTSMVLFASARVPVRTRAACTPTLAPRCSAATAYPPSGLFQLVRIRP